MRTINPFTEESISEYLALSESSLNETIELAHRAFRNYRLTSFSERAVKIAKLADVIEAHKEDYAQLMTREMGKPIEQSRSELEKCQWVCRYYAENGEKFLSPQMFETDFRKSYAAFMPIGVIFGIMPWNFPFWQVFRFAVPTLMAGNAVLLKHSPNTFGTAQAIEQAFREAGFDHLFSNLIIEVEQAASVIEHPHVRGVSLTGSTKAGKTVARQAGSVMKPGVFELGGSDAYVILDGADLDLAADKLVASRMINAGQSCIAAKRFIVTEQNAEAFTEKVIARMKQYEMDDPMNENCQLGPLARKDLREKLHEQVKKSLKQGASLQLGGQIPEKKGYFYPPTVLTKVVPGSIAFCEELFGPVASVITAKDEVQAIEWANQSEFGLGGGVFSRDIEKAEKVARDEINAGCVFVNDFVKSDPRLPFGGVKDSGMGRELSLFGIHEFVNIKTIAI